MTGPLRSSNDISRKFLGIDIWALLIKIFSMNTAWYIATEIFFVRTFSYPASRVSFDLPSCGCHDTQDTIGAIHATKTSENFGLKLNQGIGSVQSEKSFHLSRWTIFPKIYLPREFRMFLSSLLKLIWQITGNGLLKITLYTG